MIIKVSCPYCDSKKLKKGHLEYNKDIVCTTCGEYLDFQDLNWDIICLKSLRKSFGWSE